MKKTYRGYEPRQSFLLPPSPMDWLPEGHLARFVLDTIDELDLSAITGSYEREERGYPPHHPRMMVGLLMYGYCVGVTSSRKIEKKTHDDIGFRVIAGNTHPDHSRISEFRRIHLQALSGLFLQVLWMCQKRGLVKLGHVALDGTKMKANASKHKAMSYGRMKQEQEALRARVKEILEAAEAIDAEEDALYGKDKTGDELPDDLARAEGRREKIRATLKELEAEAKQVREAEAAQAKGEDEEEPGPRGMPSHRVPTTAEGLPTDKAQRNFTDPESRVMHTKDGFIQGYNCQAAVDSTHQIIVGQGVTNQPPDVQHLIPMMEQVRSNCGRDPETMSADTGYFSAGNVLWARLHGIDPYIPPERQTHNQRSKPVRGRPPKVQTVAEWMQRRLGTRRGAKTYSRRKVVVEPAFGQIKNRGFRQFLLRGIEKVRGEWALISLSHNLLKLHAASAT